MAQTTRPLARRRLLDIRPYPLGESSVPGITHVIELASNECAAEPSHRAVAAYKAAAERLRRYPDGNAADLREAIARTHRIEADRIVCGNGSEELIALLANGYTEAGDEVVVAEYGYLQFARAARIAGATAVTAPARGISPDLEALLAAVTSRTRLVFLANPNNPTGACLPASAIKEFHRRLSPAVLLVLDAACAEYVGRQDYEPGLDLARRTENVVMLRTFSQAYGLAGLRVGWLYGAADIVSVLHCARPPSNLSVAAQAAAIAALTDQDHVARVVLENSANRMRLAEGLVQLGLVPQPSEGNFLLVRFPAEPSRNASAAYRFLRAGGILVRPMYPYGLEQYLRFTIGTSEEIHAVLDALASFLG